jgi:hypothetical protein
VESLELSYKHKNQTIYDTVNVWFGQSLISQVSTPLSPEKYYVGCSSTQPSASFSGTQCPCEKGTRHTHFNFEVFNVLLWKKTAQDDKESSPFDEDESNSDNGNLSGKGLLINRSQSVEVQSLSATIFETIIRFFRDMEVADEYRPSGASSSPISGNRTSRQNEPTSTSDCLNFRLPQLQIDMM